MVYVVWTYDCWLDCYVISLVCPSQRGTRQSPATGQEEAVARDREVSQTPNTLHQKLHMICTTVLLLRNTQCTAPSLSLHPKCTHWHIHTYTQMCHLSLPVLKSCNFTASQISLMEIVQEDTFARERKSHKPSQYSLIPQILTHLLTLTLWNTHTHTHTSTMANMPQSSLPRYAHDSLVNPDYQADFLPPTTSITHSSGLFLPAVENLEYVGLNTAVQPPAC